MNKVIKSILIILLSVLVVNTDGQTLKDRLNKAVNSAAKSVGNAVGNKGNNQQEQQQNTPAQPPVQQAEVKPAEPAAPPKPEEPTLQSFSKNDFVPGEKVIFFDDFSQDATGDFPALWNTNGSAEVVTTNLFEGKWMKFACREAIWTDKVLTLPDNYTIEFDVIPTNGENEGMQGYSFRLLDAKNLVGFDHGAVPGNAGFDFKVEYYGTLRYSSYINYDGGEEMKLSGSKDGDESKQKINTKYHIAIWVQKARIRLYQNEAKVFDLPRAFNHPNIKINRVRFEDGAAMITNLRIAVGAPDTRNKLITEGRLVTYGIYFDVNKDVVKPESYGTLKEIAAALTENPGVRVKILGHTDSDGADAANLDLSKRRAESVKNELAKTFGIDAGRIETDGMGETKPIAPNDTPVNKALNRRVEFVKL
jgi:outer membrane protein OmpA-like peptidoglycan-associated protein